MKMPPGVRCESMRNRDKGGRIAARRLVRELRESGRPVEADGLYRHGESGIDAADVLAAEVGERASILEHDGGLPRDESDRRAWAGRAGRAAGKGGCTCDGELEAMGE